ncbi:hypothetical protein [Nocardioides sp.]|uniref:hypothetical protein n=1 Tax=Nocardioides sp. TaxID=35761 RepID=UPI0019B4F014|nr:hypothetical protein [Nocardioides sp.]MBC7276779.1 hypothetical protein [Nocardioides sp.]
MAVTRGAGRGLGAGRQAAGPARRAADAATSVATTEALKAGSITAAEHGPRDGPDGSTRPETSAR